MKFIATLVAFGGLASAVENYHAGKKVPHTSVSTIPDIGSGVEVANLYSPSIYVGEGCVPFAAVDNNGHVSGGLKPSGGRSDGCGRSPGQTYSRELFYHQELLAVVFAWYLPKTQGEGEGHSTRHAWLWVVLWADMVTAAPIALDTSGDGIVVHYPRVGFTPLVRFTFDGKNGERTHSDGGSARGSTEPIADWAVLSPVVKAQLNNAENWGGKPCPICDVAPGQPGGFMNLLNDSRQRLYTALRTP